LAEVLFLEGVANMHTRRQPKSAQVIVFTHIPQCEIQCAKSLRNSLMPDFRRNVSIIDVILDTPSMQRIEATQCRQLPYFAPFEIPQSPVSKKQKNDSVDHPINLTTEFGDRWTNQSAAPSVD
jgi:hypothetical protein